MVMNTVYCVYCFAQKEQQYELKLDAVVTGSRSVLIKCYGTLLPNLPHKDPAFFGSRKMELANTHARVIQENRNNPEQGEFLCAPASVLAVFLIYKSGSRI